MSDPLAWGIRGKVGIDEVTVERKVAERWTSENRPVVPLGDYDRNNGLHMRMIRWLIAEPRSHPRTVQIGVGSEGGWVVVLREPIFGTESHREVVVEAGEIPIGRAIEQALETWQKEIEA